MSKSHVGMGFALCPVCGKKHDETVLLQRSMGAPPRLNSENFTGWELCPEDKAKFDEGYVALIECEEPPTGDNQLATAKRTGVLVHVRRTAFPNIFNVPAPKGAIAFIERGVVEQLQAMMPPEEN